MSRAQKSTDPDGWTMHVGPMGSLNGADNYEVNWKDLDGAGSVGKQFDSRGGWLGFTDEYWLIVLAPVQNAAVAASFGLLGALSVAVLGDESGYTAGEHQKMKIAVIEGMWHTEPAPAGFNLVGLPDMEARETRYAIRIPWVLGLIATRSLTTEIPGIIELVERERGAERLHHRRRTTAHTLATPTCSNVTSMIRGRQRPTRSARPPGIQSPRCGPCSGRSE